VISFAWSAVLFFTGMAGTSPAMTWSCSGQAFSSS
jgi:hypothetical protein